MNKCTLLFLVSAMGSFASAKEIGSLQSLGTGGVLVKGEYKDVAVTVRLKETKFEYAYDFGKLENSIANHDDIKSAVDSCIGYLSVSARSLEENHFTLTFFIQRNEVKRIGYKSETTKGIVFGNGDQYGPCISSALRAKFVKK